MNDKIKASFLLGACGDALGAPLEGMRHLDLLIRLYGEKGLAEIIEFKNVFGQGFDYPAGRITDDTTMAMTTAAALILACREMPPRSPEFTGTLKRFLWQGDLNWAQFQDNSPALSGKIDASGAWPSGARDFWFPCGAGRR